MAGNFFQQVKNVANQAVDSTKNVAQKTKIKTKIQSENSKLDKLYTEVGRYYYNINKDNAPEEIKQVFDNINQGLSNIAALEKECREIEEQEQRSNYNYQQPQQGMYQQQGMPQQGYYNQQPQQGMYQQQNVPQQQYVNNGMPQQGYYNQQPQQGMPQPQYANNGMPQQGYYNQQPQQGMYQQQNVPQPQYANNGMPQQGAMFQTEASATPVDNMQEQVESVTNVPTEPQVTDAVNSTEE